MADTGLVRMRTTVLSILSVLPITGTGCGLVFHGLHQQITVTGVPPGTHVLVNGVSGTAPNITARRSKKPLLVRAEHEGQAGCAIAIPRRDRLVTTFDSIPAAIPLLVDAATGANQMYPDTLHIRMQAALPSDAAILADWNEGIANRCLATPPILLSPGPVNVPYEILGSLTVSLDQANVDTYAAYQQETTRAPRTQTEHLLGVMIYEARRRFGDRVNAIINTDPTFGPDAFSIWLMHSREGERAASGLAVHLLTPPIAPPSAAH